MNRLQKKCLVTTAGFHLLLMVILLVGPGFFAAKTRPVETSGDFAPITLLPAPGLATSEPNSYTPPLSRPNQNQDNPSPNLHRVTPNLNLVVRPNPHTGRNNHSPAAGDLRNLHDQRTDAIRNAIEDLKNHFTTGTDVVSPVSGEAVDPGYIAVVKEKYSTAWLPPDDTASDAANTKVSVTIGSDGTVISSRILNPSGDVHVDGSVQRTLDRVIFVAPFPDGAKEKQRTFIINFNLKAKRQLG
jgi:TonB family protein